MGREFDPQELTGTLLSVMQQTLAKAGNIPQSQEPNIESKEIEEYDGLMKASGISRFNSICYLSVVNFYLSQADLDKHKGVKGTLIFYIAAENAGKFYKALEIPFSDDEDDASMMVACGKFCQGIADDFKTELTRKGYAELFLSKPRNYKNNVAAGVEFSTDQKTVHEVSFFYFKHKAISADITLAPIPKK